MGQFEGKSDSNNAEPRRGRSRRRAVAWFLARWSMVGAIWTGFFALLFLAWCAYDLPGPERLNELKRQPSVTVRRRRRLADRELWRSLWQFGAAGRPAALSAGRRARDRGPALLQPLGRRPARRRARALRQRQGRRHGAGRQHHHPAGCEKPVPDARAQPASQGPGDAAGAVAGAHLHQGPDPRALSQPGLFRRRHLWRRRGGEEVFRPLGARRHDLPGGDAGRPAQGAVALQSVQRPGPRQGARRAGDPQHGGRRPADRRRSERDLRNPRRRRCRRRPATRSASISPTG